MTQYDLIVKGGTIITLDNDLSILENGIVAVNGDRIEALLPHPEEGRIQAKEVIDARGGLVLPGLINAHTHAAMSLFRGLADDLPLMDWLNYYIFPAEKKMDSDFVYIGSLLACAEMILSGTTTFCDMYLFENSVAQAAGRAGMRALVGEVLYDFDSPNYGSIENGFSYTEGLILKWADDPLVSVAVMPHSTFTCSPDLLVKANELALKHHVPLVIHLAETQAEVREVVERYGKRPAEHLKDLGILGPHCLAAHCIHLNENEIDLLADKDVKIAHNPESNMKLASGVAPIPEMIDRNLAVGLGTDGCASNNNLDMFGEMDTAAKLHKIVMMDTTAADAITVLKMATINGARALGMEHLIGTLEPGKKADIIVVDTRSPHLTPLYNPYSQLVYAAMGSDVTTSIIDGKVVMKDKKLRTLDPEEIMEKAREKSFQVKKWISMGGKQQD